jgi:hypothetical protein
MRYIFFILILGLFVSCSKDDKQTQQQNAPKNQVEDIDDNPADTNLTPEEKFSTAIMLDFLNDSDDEDLSDFLEDQVYKMGANFRGASLVELNPSTWLLMLEKDGVTKNYLIQKFVDFTTNEDYFRMKETALTITDVISRGKVKTTAGEQ